jgi:hypothetical protein
MATSIQSDILGTWLLVSMTYENAEGRKINLYGENPRGILMYDTSGYMNAQMGFAHKNIFKSNSLGDGSSEEISSAYKSYMGYYGKYYESSPGVVVHEVDDCLFPNWRGKKEIRYATIKNNILIITTPPTLFGNHEIVIEAIWRRP